MISIDNNFNIEASQYDTYTIRFKFKDYVLTGDDKFRFSIKATSNSTDVVFSKDVYNAGFNYVDLSIVKALPAKMLRVKAKAAKACPAKAAKVTAASPWNAIVTAAMIREVFRWLIQIQP